jgi:heme-degrading monooxygenase HmoA
MPALGWKSVSSVPAESEPYVMASRFEVRSLPDSFRFFAKSLSAWSQVRRAPGAFGAALLAHPFQRVYYTLSAWEDRDALYAFAKTEPHKSIMNLRSVMRQSTFTFWTIPATGVPVSWAEAKRRIDEEAAKAGSGDASPAETPS